MNLVGDKMVTKISFWSSILTLQYVTSLKAFR